MTNKFFQATHDQVRALTLLLGLLTAIVFGPALKGLAMAALRENPVHAGLMEVAVPWSWRVEIIGSSIEAWKPAMSIISQRAPASMKISQLNGPHITEAMWRRTAEGVLREKSLSSLLPRTVRGPLQPIECIEGTTEEVRRRVISSCFVPETRISATFEGELSDLNDFYSIMTSARVRGGN